MQIKDYGGIGGLKTINIRSMGTRHVGVFFDGIQLGNAQNGQIDLGRFSLDNMESISLYNGREKSGIQPAKRFRIGRFDLHADANPVSTGTEKQPFRRVDENRLFRHRPTPSILWEHRFNDRLSSSFNVEYLYTTGRYKFSYTKKNGYDTLKCAQRGDIARPTEAEGGLFRPGTQRRMESESLLLQLGTGLPGRFGATGTGRFRHEDRSGTTTFSYRGSFRKTFSPFYSLLLNGKYAYDYLHYLSDPRLDESTMYVNNHYYQQETYLSAANEFTFFKWWKKPTSPPISNGTRWTPTWSISSIRSAIRY